MAVDNRLPKNIQYRHPITKRAFVFTWSNVKMAGKSCIVASGRHYENSLFLLFNNRHYQYINS